jgi:hypothetical protein
MNAPNSMSSPAGAAAPAASSPAGRARLLDFRGLNSF